MTSVARVVEGGVGVSRRVPWHVYADGRVWELERGVDYEQDDEHARRAAKAWAYRRGAEFRTSVPSPGRLRIQFLDHLGNYRDSGLRSTV